MSERKYVYLRTDHSALVAHVEQLTKNTLVSWLPLWVPGHFVLLAGQSLLALAVLLSLGNEVASWWRYPVCAFLMANYLLLSIGGRLQAQRRMRYSALTELIGHLADALAMGEILFILSELFFIEDTTLSAYLLTSFYLTYYATALRQLRSGKWVTERYSFAEAISVVVVVVLLSAVPLVKVLFLQTVYNHYTVIEVLLLCATIGAFYTTILQLLKAFQENEQGITRKFLMACIWLILMASATNILFESRTIFLFTTLYAVGHLMKMKNCFLLGKEEPQADLMGPLALVLVFLVQPETLTLWSWGIGLFLIGYLSWTVYQSISPYLLLWNGKEAPQLK